MKIIWKCCKSYDEAKNYSRIIYLHEWNEKPFYWGKAHNSFFGGNKRKVGDLLATGRYNPGYRHWIEGCLRGGGCLYVGQLDKEAIDRIDEVENYLINTYGSEMNTKVKPIARELDIKHEGQIPASITNSVKI